MDEKPTRFEDAFARLSEIVETLERGETGLEESLNLYAEGMTLVKLCGHKLNEAEKKIERLSAEAGIPDEELPGPSSDEGKS